MAEWVYFLLGSNEGERDVFLRKALEALAGTVAVGPLLLSSVFETAAWGLEAQPPFLNLAAGMETVLSPEEILQAIRDIEHKLGRQRDLVWGQRTLDIDVLLFGNQIVHTPELSIPHPRMQDRRFALAPLAEIAADVVHPVLGKTIAMLLEDCVDPLAVARVGGG